MKHTLLAGAAALVVISNPALAQSVAVEINPAQRAQIKNYVVQQKVAPVRVNESILLGNTVPAGVELQPVAGWGPTVSRYRYVYADNRIYFVDPSSRRVVRIVE